jgi:T5orf172 domain
MAGIIYILTNQAMPGLVKIGQTQGAVEDRMRQLDTTGIPLPFECFYAVEVPDPARAERAIHEAFDDHRLRKNREYFRISPDRPKAILELVQVRNVTPGYDVVSEPGDQAALDEARERRSKFNFAMVGLKTGDELTSVFDEEIRAVVAPETNKIIFRSEVMSLSKAALIIAHEKGYGWSSIAGPTYWKINGRTLAELRDEIEDL